MTGVLSVWLGGCTLLGPGFAAGADVEAILSGREAYVPAEYVPPVPASLSPNERRRAGVTVKLAVAAAEQALTATGQARDLPSVFGTSNGDGAVVHAMLQAVAGPEPLLSPTQFHNSVHNAAAAYWSIGSACRANSTSIGGFDDTFASALLHAAMQVVALRQPVLLCVYDAPLPFPLSSVRATRAPMAAAAVLTPGPTEASQAAMDISFAPGAIDVASLTSLVDGELAGLLDANPAGRALPLFQAVARRKPAAIRLPYLEDSHLAIEVRPA